MGRYLSSREMHHSGSSWVLVQESCTPTPGQGMRFLWGLRPKNEARGVHLWANRGLVSRGMSSVPQEATAPSASVPWNMAVRKKGLMKEQPFTTYCLKLQHWQSHQAPVKPNVAFPSSVLFLLSEPLAFLEHQSGGCCELSLFELSRCWIYFRGSLILS